MNAKEKKAIEVAYSQGVAKAFDVLVDGTIQGDAEALARFQKALSVLRESLALAMASDEPKEKEGV